MRKHVSPSALARWALAAALTSLWGACEKEAPPPPQQLPASAPQSPPAAPVPPGETYVLSNLRLRYDEQRSLLIGSYEVRNRGTRRVRAFLCIDFIDKDGYFVYKGNSIERISLDAGQSDLVLDEEYFVPPSTWNPTEVLRVSIQAGSCANDSEDLRSAVLWLDKTGQPLPAGERPEGKESEEREASPTFRLEDARLSQQGRGEVRLSYRVTNLVQGRVSGTLCARLTNDLGCSCRGVDEARFSDLEMGLGASEVRSERVELRDEANWDRGQHLVLFMGRLGCNTPPAEITSNVLTLARPPSIRAPEKREEEEAQE